MKNATRIPAAAVAKAAAAKRAAALMFHVRASTIGAIMQADNMSALQKRLGLSALLELAEDAVGIKIGHGSAVALAALLKNGGLTAARSKYYSEKACQLAAAIQHRAVLNSAKVRGEAAKGETRQASMAADFAELASMASISAAQKWAKKNGPKSHAEKIDEAAEKIATTPDTASDNQPSAQAIEAAGQLREVREIIEMVMTGQLSDKDAVSAIAETLGMKRGATLADIAKAKGKAALQKAA